MPITRPHLITARPNSSNSQKVTLIIPINLLNNDWSEISTHPTPKHATKKCSVSSFFQPQSICRTKSTKKTQMIKQFKSISKHTTHQKANITRCRYVLGLPLGFQWNPNSYKTSTTSHDPTLQAHISHTKTAPQIAKSILHFLIE